MATSSSTAEPYWYEFQRLEIMRREIETHLAEMLLRAFRRHYPDGVNYRFDVFDSDNGDDDWEYAVAVNLWVTDLGIEEDDPLYALCDGPADEAISQAAYLFDQLVAEGRSRGVVLR